MSTSGIRRFTPPYSAWVTLWKALWVYWGSIGVIGAAEVAQAGVPLDWTAFALDWPRYAIALAPAAWKIIENIRKNWRDDGRELWVWPWHRLVPKP